MDLMKELGLEHYIPHRALRGGVINPYVMVQDLLQNHRWDRAHSTQDPTSILHGWNIPKDDKLHRGFDGNGYDILRAISSLHPIFFAEGGYQEHTAKDRAEIIAAHFTTTGGLLTVPYALVDSLSRTPIGEILAEGFRGYSDRPARDSRPARNKGGALNKRFTTLLNTLKIPIGETTKGTPEDNKKAHFEMNAEHILLGMRGNDTARKFLSKAVFASLLSAREGQSMDNPLKQEFSATLGVQPIHPNEIRDVPVTSDMGAKYRTMPATSPARAEFAELSGTPAHTSDVTGPAGGVTPGNFVGVLGPKKERFVDPYPAGSQNLIRRSER